MLSWGLTAAGLLLFVYAVRSVFVGARAEDGSRQEKLGCGFAFVATLLWVWVLDHHLDDPWRAMRIGFGLLLVLPAVQAIAKPGGARILRAAAGLVLAALVAGPPLKGVWNDYGPDLRPQRERELDQTIAEFEQLRERLGARLSALDELHARLKTEIGTADWAQVQADPALLEKLELLARVEEERATVTGELAQIDARLPRLRAALARAATDTATDDGDAADELEALLRSLENRRPLDELSLVERHLRKQELEQLFEREF